jgi:probable HAF family extracellular repeat protein
MRKSRVSVCVAVVLGLVVVGGTVPAAADVRAPIDLGTLPDGVYSATTAINNQGAVAGISRTTDGVFHPVRWSRNGTITQLSLPDGVDFGQTVDINESNTVLGYYQGQQLETHPAVWDASGRRTDLPLPPGTPYSLVNDMNNAGTVVGYVSPNPVRWNTNGTVTVLPLLPGGTGGQAVAINDAGTIVGFSRVPDGTQHAVRWSPDGRITDLGTLGGGYSDSVDVNERGAVAGQAQGADGAYHAVRWPQNGRITELSPADSKAVAINDRGVVVGSSGGAPVRWTGTTPTALPLLVGDFQGFAVDVNRTGVVAGISGDPFSSSRGVVWDAAGAATELGPVPGGQTTSVNDINDRGEVVGNMRTANGDVHAVRW